MALKVVTALSGGVDSSVAALLLLERGFEVIGATLLLNDEGGDDEVEKRGTFQDVAAAEEVCRKLSIEHHTLDGRTLFAGTVKKSFLKSIELGLTPNPCITCNEKIKFEFLLEWAKSVNAGLISTGHYARIVRNAKGEFELHRGMDKSKEQSYFLYSVPEAILAKTIFPLEDLTKREVRQIAKGAGLPTSEKDDSQDICFGKKERFADFLRRNGILEEEGPVFLFSGGKIGTHKGLSGYTVGQRKGIAIPFAEPLYVIRIDKRNNALIVGPKEKAFTKRFRVSGWAWKNSERKDSLEMQVRYRQKALEATLTESGDGHIIEWRDEMEIAAPGQAAVGYDGTKVLGGGWIVGDGDG